VNERVGTIPKPILGYFAVAAGLWACCLALMGYWHFALRRHYPYTLIFIPHTLFGDFHIFDERFRSLHSQRFFSPDIGIAFQYPAPGAMVYAFFDNLIPRFHFAAFLAVTLAGFALLLLLFARKVMQLGWSNGKAAGMALVGTLSMYPLLFAVHQGNIECILFLLLAGSVIALLRGRFVLAAVMIAVCASMKLYPFVLMAIFLSLKRYKEMVLAGLVFVASNIISLWILCPQIGYAWRSINEGLKISRATYMLVFLRIETPIDHSGFGVIKTILFHFKGHAEVSSRTLSLYMALMACTGLVLYFGRIRKLPLLNQIACLYVCMVSLTPESFSYTLAHLAVVWALLVLYTLHHAASGNDVRRMTPVFVCLACLLAPLNELVRNGIGYWGQVQWFLLIALLCVSLTYRWEGFEALSWVSPKLWPARETATGEPATAS
jgi:hypothetical protein